MNIYLLRLMALLLTSIFSIAANAATLKVDHDGGRGQFTKIQIAVDAAHAKDTILISDGIYTGDGNRDIDFHGKSCTLKSLNGASKTIIDCGGCKSLDGSGDHRGFYLHSGEKNVTISGFTVKNGYESHQDLGVADSGSGGGVVNSGGTGIITLGHCIISGNAAQGGSGVTNVNGGTITLSHCVISGNTALRGNGGGVFNGNDNSGTVVLTHCIISKNTASESGGGIYNSSRDGGAVKITNCLIGKNTANYNGGGVYNYNYKRNPSDPPSGNTIQKGGENGGNGTITLTNCIVSDNNAKKGGGLYNFNNNGGTITLTNCTVFGNDSDTGGVFDYNFKFKGSSGISMITVSNCIFYHDIGGEIANEAEGLITSKAIVTYSDVQSNVQSVFPGPGNINADPLFANAAAGDLHLKRGSLCLGAGNRAVAPITDKDGKPRPRQPSIGAYEMTTAR